MTRIQPQEGDHSSLIAKGGLYSVMVREQQGTDIQDDDDDLSFEDDGKVEDDQDTTAKTPDTESPSADAQSDEPLKNTSDKPAIVAVDSTNTEKPGEDDDDKKRSPRMTRKKKKRRCR